MRGRKAAHLEGLEHIKVLFVAGFGPIVPDKAASRRLYGETLGMGLPRFRGQAIYAGSAPMRKSASVSFGVL